MSKNSVKVCNNTIQNIILYVYNNKQVIHMIKIIKEFFLKLFRRSKNELKQMPPLKSYNEEYEKWLGV